MEQFSNNAQTTLAAAISSGATSLTVTSAALFPSSGTFRILIGSEILAVTAVSGTTFTVTRGTEGTAAAAHGYLSTVTCILTAAAIEQLKTDVGGSGRIGAYASSRMAVDANTWALWKFAPSSGDAVVNDGQGGASLDLALNSTVRLDTHYNWISDRRALFGKCLSLQSNGSNAVANVPRWATSASVVPSGNTFTISGIFTPFNLHVPFSTAAILVKAHALSSWLSPYYKLSFGFNMYGTNLPNEYTLGVDASGLSNMSVRTTRVQSHVAFGQPHTLAATFEYGAAQARVYLDGELVYSDLTNVASAKDMGNGQWFVGSNYGDHSEYMSGLIHELRVDQGIRSASWALEHYQRALGIIAP